MAEVVEQHPAPEDEQYAAPHEREWPRPWMRPFLQALTLVPDVSAACRAAGVAKSTAYRYRDPNDVAVYLEAFAAAWDEAKQLQRDNFERIVHQWATTGLPVEETLEEVEYGPPDANGQPTVLKRRTRTTRRAVRSERLAERWLISWYGDRYHPSTRVEQTGAGGGPIVIETVDQLDAKIKELNEEIDRRGGTLVLGDGTPAPTGE